MSQSWGSNSVVDYTFSICKTLVLIPWMQGGGTGQQNMKFSKSVSSLNKQILFHKSFQHCFLVLPGSPCSHRYGSSLSCSCLSPASLSFSSHCVPDRSTSYWYMFITQALTPSVPWRLAPSLLKLFSSLTEAPPLSSPLLRTVPLPFFYSSSNTRSGIHKQPPNGFPTNVLS